MQYIRSRAQALDAAADVLEIPDRADQLVQSVVRIMLCLDAEARDFLVGCQALLVQGGLDELRRRRIGVLPAPETDVEAVAAALDALRFADVVRQVFPSLRAERWIVARALLAREEDVRSAVSSALRSRGGAAVDAARTSLDLLLAAARPAWIDRAGSLLAACRSALGPGEPSEAAALFELAALDDPGALHVLDTADRDPASAAGLLGRLRDLADAVGDLRVDDPGRPPGSREVA